MEEQAKIDAATLQKEARAKVLSDAKNAEERARESRNRAICEAEKAAREEAEMFRQKAAAKQAEMNQILRDVLRS